ncbi:MAG: phosphoribosylanthranilate isomerase [Verrucomicrobiota bacterium]|jgi:phosphoribosylanthranilate isomerase
MSVRVKICGITRAEDARAAIDAGADALGFMLWRSSPRFVTLAAAASILRELPPFVARVGVFVNPSEAEVRSAIETCGIDTLQFHGEEPPEFCRQFGLKVVKAFRVRDADSLKPMANYEGQAWLLDSHVKGQPGGTGTVFNWELAATAVKEGGCIILAGGLAPENAADAVRRVHPYALDVSSGVESVPGKKDAVRMRAFIAAAKGV